VALERGDKGLVVVQLELLERGADTGDGFQLDLFCGKKEKKALEFARVLNVGREQIQTKGLAMGRKTRQESGCKEVEVEGSKYFPSCLSQYLLLTVPTGRKEGKNKGREREVP